MRPRLLTLPLALSLAACVLPQAPAPTPVPVEPNAVIRQATPAPTPSPQDLQTPTPAPVGALAGRVLAPAGVTAAKGMDLIPAGSLHARLAYRLHSRGDRRLLALTQGYLGEGAPVQLFTAQNVPVTTVVTTTADGSYFLPTIPTTGGPYVLKVGVLTATGKPATLETVIRTGEAVSGDVDLTTTLVTAAVVSLAGGKLDAARGREFKRAANAVAAGLAEDATIDLTDFGDMVKTVRSIGVFDAELRANLDVLIGKVAASATPGPTASPDDEDEDDEDDDEPTPEPTDDGTPAPLTGPRAYTHVRSLVGLTNTPGYVDDPSAAKVQVRTPMGIAFDGAGYMYIADRTNFAIRRVAPDGAVTTLAGGTSGATVASCSGADARFGEPIDVAVRDNNSLWVLDRGNRDIRLITHLGGQAVTVTKFSGKGTAGFVEGDADTAQYDTLQGFCYDGLNALFVADARDTGDARILKVDAATGAMTRYAGGARAMIDGDATTARFRRPTGVAARWTGGRREVWVADPLAGNIRRIVEQPSGTIAVTVAAGATEAEAIAPDPRVYAHLDTLPLTSARFKKPSKLHFSPAGDLFVLSEGQSGGWFVRWLPFASGEPTRITTLRPELVSTGGSTSPFELNAAAGLAMDPLTGNLCVSQNELARVSVIEP